MSVSYYTLFTKVQDVFGEIQPVAGFHKCMLEAGIHRVERWIVIKFPRHRRFLKHVCRSAMSKEDVHTILLESFGTPLIAIQNLSYTFQPLEERKVYVIQVEKAFAEWSRRISERDKFDWAIAGTLILCGISMFIAVSPTSFRLPKLI